MHKSINVSRQNNNEHIISKYIIMLIYIVLCSMYNILLYKIYYIENYIQYLKFYI